MSRALRTQINPWVTNRVQRSFQRASAWNTNQSYLHRSHPQQQQQQPQTHKFKKVSPKNKIKFQLWSEHQQQWSNRITSPPKILTERDISSWQHFRTQRLQYSQLYLWHPTPNEWVPMWALDGGFLLLHTNFIRYSEISYDQITRTKWVHLNCVDQDKIQQLLGKFNMTIESYAGKAQSAQRQPRPIAQTVTGTPYYTDDPQYHLPPKMYQSDIRSWSLYSAYNKHCHRFNYEFIKYYHLTYHQRNLNGNLNVLNFKEAAQKAENGNAYIYHERDLYIPFWKSNEQSIQLNSKHYVKINTINDNFCEHNHIKNNRHNSLTKQEYDQLQPLSRNLFIDKKLMKYRIEFIYNCVGIVPYETWTTAKSITDMDPKANDGHTLFLLTQDGFNGFPIGIDTKSANCILLNDGNYYTIPQVVNRFNNKQIDLGITLDFNGTEDLVKNGGELHNQFLSVTQQMAKIEAKNIKNLFVHDYLAGHYVLIDYGTDWFLPIYVLNDEYVRAQSHIIHVRDLIKYLHTHYERGDFVLKIQVTLEHNYITLSSQEYEVEEEKTNYNNQNNKNKRHVTFNLPNIQTVSNQIPNIPQGSTTQAQAIQIGIATENAINRVSDFQQFSNMYQMQQPQQLPQQQSQQQQETAQQETVQSQFPQPIQQQFNENKEDDRNDINNQVFDGFIGQVAIEPVLHDSITLEKIFSMAKERRDEYLTAQLQARIVHFDPMAKSIVPHLLHFDIEQLVAALNDNQYLFELMDELNQQLFRRKSWSDEQKNERPFWYNPDPVPESGGKNEMEIIEDDPSVSISMELTRMPTRNAKIAYIGTILYPKIQDTHPHQVNRLYSICMNYEFQVLQNAVTNKNALSKLLTQAQIQLEQESNKPQIMTAEPMLNNENDNNENKDDNDDNMNIDNENNMDEIDSSEIDINVNVNQNRNQNNDNNNNNDNNDNSNDNKEKETTSPQTPPNFQIQDEKDGDSKINDEINKYVLNKRKEMAFKMLDSWNDRKYSHLRTFRHFKPMFSKRDKLYDHSTKTMVFNDDEIFVTKDIITHTSKRSYNAPADYIRFRFSCDTIKEENGLFDFFYKFTVMRKEIRGIWDDIEKKDFAAQIYRLNDNDFSEKNKMEKYEKMKESWLMEHNRVRGNYNHPDHPGVMPEFVPISEMNENDKLNDRTGSIYNINVSKANCGCDYKPIKNGTIYWNEQINLTNYVDLYFQQDAKFTQTPNWDKIMMETFEKWQERRQGMEYDPKVVMTPYTTLNIMKPQEKCTISINIPFKRLKDHGNQAILYNEVVRIFQHYNYLNKLENKSEVFPIKNIRTVTRGRKNQRIINQKWINWQSWKRKHSRYYNRLSESKQMELENQHFHDQILINQVFVDFDIWVENIPSKIDYSVGVWQIQRKNARSNQLEKRLRSLYQCYTCGGIACHDKRCRHFNETVIELCEEYGIDWRTDKNGRRRDNDGWERMKRLMGRFCHHCGKNGGHHRKQVKCKKHCKWCGSDEHDSTISPRCPFWNCWGIISLLYNPYFIRNQMNPHGYLAWDGDLDPKWDINMNLKIEKTPNNAPIYPQLIRQLEILKYLCCKNDVFYTMDKHIRLMERIYHVFNGTKKEFEEAKALNEKKEKYYLNKFVLRQKLDLGGNNIETENKIDIDNIGNKMSKEFYDYTQVCWNCGNDVYLTESYKMCPNINCQTKYCDKCWEEVFEKQSKKGQPTGRSAPMLSICKFIKCYMCKKTEYQDFSIIDKNNQILFESDKYKNRSDPLQDYRDQQEWDLDSISERTESDSESDSDLDLNNLNDEQNEMDDDDDNENDDDDDDSDSSDDSLMNLNKKDRDKSKDEVGSVLNQNVYESLQSENKENTENVGNIENDEKVDVSVTTERKNQSENANSNKHSNSNEYKKPYKQAKMHNFDHVYRYNQEMNKKIQEERKKQRQGQQNRKKTDKKQDENENLRIKRKKKKKSKRQRKRQRKKEKRDRMRKELDNLLDNNNNANENGNNNGGDINDPNDNINENNNNNNDNNNNNNNENNNNGNVEHVGNGADVENVGNGINVENGDQQDNQGDSKMNENSQPAQTGIVEDNRNRNERPDAAPNILTYTFPHKMEKQVELTMDMLNQMPNEHDRKQAIGERLFLKIHEKEPENAGKLTSLILTLEIDQLFPLMSNNEELDKMIGVAKERMKEKKETKSNEKQTIENIVQRVQEMRNTHETAISNLLSPNSGNNGDPSSSGSAMY